jgi:hypothetical protein
MLNQTLNRTWLLNGKEYKEGQDIECIDNRGIKRFGFLRKIHEDKDQVDVRLFDELFPEEGKYEMITKDKLL